LNLRTKLLLVFIALAFVPLVALSAFNCWSALRAVEGLVREAAQDREARTTQRLEMLLDGQEDRLLILAGSASLRDFVRDTRRDATGEPRGAETPSGESEVLRAVRSHLGFFYRNNRAYYQTITIVDATGRPLCRVSGVEGVAEGEAHFQTADIVASGVRYDEGVWSLTRPKALRSALSHEATHGTILGTTVPIFETPEGGVRPLGALFVEIRLKEILEDAAQSGARAAGGDGADPRASSHVVVALENGTGRVVYHTTEGLKHRPASEAMPYFRAVEEKMRAGGSGTEFYREADGDHWLAAYRQVRGVNLSLAAAENYTAASAGVRRAGLWGVALATLAGLAAATLLLLIVRRATSRIERVARAASAIAGGDLDQRIEIEGHDETSRLAESFNLMSDRLRELIRRESESKQFESFMRLSAMLTHDLKNAITGLLMLVSNMEKRFDRQEFRADAITSLRDATEKLRRIVSRLSEPMRSLSGEYRRDSRPTDLVPIIRRVLAAHAEPSRPLYDIEARLPASLVATVEAERIENVIENLVINALEAMGAAGGRLTVEAGEAGERQVFIAVSDTGVGMNEEFLKTRLFRPFSTTKTRGVGLGLFTCKEIVETHGGRLEVESESGVGTRFRIVLPSSLFKSGERRGRTTRGTSASGQVEPGVPD
jgi:signal transduction histidine kinase